MPRSFTANSNDSMWKLLCGISGLIIGAYIGASMPELVFKPTNQSVNQSISQSTDGEKEDEPSLCSGPECMTAPAPKIPSNIQAVNLANAYLLANIQIAVNQSMNQSINRSINQSTKQSINDRKSINQPISSDEIERFALMIGAVSQYSNYQSINQSINSNRLVDLIDCLTKHGYKINQSIDQSMTQLRSAIQTGKSVIVNIQSISQSINQPINQSEIDWLKVEDSARPMLVVGYDSFYIYVLDCNQSINQSTNTSIDLLYCPAREFSRRWHSINQSINQSTNQSINERVNGEAIIIESPMAPSATKDEAKKMFANVKLKQLL